LGLAQSLVPEKLTDLREVLRRLGHELFVAQAELARAPSSPRPTPAITVRHVERLEAEIDRFDAQHPPLASFVLPGGSTPASALHVARTVARRAERELVALNREEAVEPVLLAWANRLSDLLFALALATNHALGVSETPPQYDV
jgi:cob(I)alamin adenosyltransferase